MVWAALGNIYADSQDIEICAGSNKGKLGNYGEDALKFSWNTLRLLRSGRGYILPLNFFPKKKKKIPVCSSVTYRCDWEFSQSDQGNKISQQIFGYHENYHLQCITEIFRNSKKVQNKTKQKTQQQQ